MTRVYPTDLYRLQPQQGDGVVIAAQTDQPAAVELQGYPARRDGFIGEGKRPRVKLETASRQLLFARLPDAISIPVTEQVQSC